MGHGMGPRTVIRFSLLVFAVSVAVCLPFLLFGEDAVTPALQSLDHHAAWVAIGCVSLLSLDAVLPVPSAWVLIFLALHTGPLGGIVGGTAGLSIGVLVSSWVGRMAVGRLAPRLIPDHELARLADSISRHATLTLACMRSVPVLAETSVMIAAAAGVPPRRIFLATLLPNLAISTVYTVAASDSLLIATIAFAATIVVSYGSWRVFNALSASRLRAP